MGQGHYAALAFGSPGFSLFKPEDVYEQIEDLMDGIHCDYECKRPYVGIRLADSGGCDDVHLDDFIGGCIALHKLAEKVSDTKETRAARKRWAKFQKAAAKKGVVVPDGVLFLLADYD